MNFNFEATGIGSVPFKDAKTACRVIFENLRTIPFWPQLPKRSYLENMYIQFSEKLPGLVLDTDKKTIHIDTSKVSSEIEKVYGKYLDGDLEFFRIAEEYAEGFYEFLEHLKKPDKDMKFVKAQITGPVSYGLFLTDENKRSILYDKDLFEVLTKVLIMRARWQIKAIKKLFPNVIMFIDEPYLVSIGSSFVNIDIDEVGKKLDDLIGAIKNDGALVGVHCCGNTDWSFLLKRDIDILNYDAYNFTKEFSLYAADIKNFIKKGGTIAWGIVPSSEDVSKENSRSLAERLEDAIKALADKGVPKDLSSLITPSCGLGSLDEKTAEAIFNLTGRLSAGFKKR